MKNHNQREPGALQSSKEIVQNLKKAATLGSFKIFPGGKLFEMVVVDLKGNMAGSGWIGREDLNGPTFDPELAEIREVDLSSGATALFGTPGINAPGMVGPILPGQRHRVQAVAGNFYEVAINKDRARAKIIKKYFSYVK